MEIERKWLFDMKSVPIEKSPVKVIYKQAYLSVEPEVRIRAKRTEGNKRYPMYQNVACESDTYMLCIKGDGLLTRIEVQKELTEEEFKQLKEVGKLSDKDFIHKSHYEIPIDFNNKRYILTVGEVDSDRSFAFAYGEIEFESEAEAQAFEPPIWFGKEVTYDASYKMKNYWKRTRRDTK